MELESALLSQLKFCVSYETAAFEAEADKK